MKVTQTHMKEGFFQTCENKKSFFFSLSVASKMNRLNLNIKTKAAQTTLPVKDIVIKQVFHTNEKRYIHVIYVVYIYSYICRIYIHKHKLKDQTVSLCIQGHPRKRKKKMLNKLTDILDGSFESCGIWTSSDLLKTFLPPAIRQMGVWSPESAGDAVCCHQVLIRSR